MDGNALTAATTPKSDGQGCPGVFAASAVGEYFQFVSFSQAPTTSKNKCTHVVPYRTSSNGEIDVNFNADPVQVATCREATPYECKQYQQKESGPECQYSYGQHTFAAPSAFEAALLHATNVIRTNPESFVAKLEAMLPKYVGRWYQGPEGAVLTAGGAADVSEAIQFLKDQAATKLKDGPAPALYWNQRLAAAAAAHVAAQGADGTVGYADDAGVTTQQRLDEYAVTEEPLTSIAYGGPTPAYLTDLATAGVDPTSAAEDLVIRLLIGDGDAARTDRAKLFAKESEYFGAGTGTHASGAVTTINYAAVV